jgi:fluoride exporter
MQDSFYAGSPARHLFLTACLKPTYNAIMMKLFLVGIGGFTGAVARYVIALWIGQRWGRSFPLGTFVINVSGSFLIGLLMTLMAEKFTVDPQWRLLLVVGFLGAYTTFSTFEYETGALLKDGEWAFAMLNIILSVVAGFIALKLGEGIAKSI